jgi:R3H domain
MGFHALIHPSQGFFHNDEILRARDRILPYVCSRVLCAGRNKNTSIPEELYDQWERDRAKKAERKRLRDLERMAAALDPFMTRKGGKKARKARLAAALAAPVTLETVVGYMRRFVADIGGARTLPLPPMGREMRKSVHELAEAFKLKSKSQGKGVGRFTSLIKTTFSGITVNEEKVTRILGRSSSPPFHATHRGERGKGRAGRARPHDGEVVGEVRCFQCFLNDFGLIYICQGGSQAQRVEHRLQDVICYGMGRGPPNWGCWRVRSAVSGRYKDDKIRPRCEYA